MQQFFPPSKTADRYGRKVEKLFVLLLLTHICLYHAHRAEVFLDNAIQVVILLEHFFKIGVGFMMMPNSPMPSSGTAPKKITESSKFTVIAMDRENTSMTGARTKREQSFDRRSARW